MNTNLYNSHITTQEEWDAQEAEYLRRPASERAQLEVEPETLAMPTTMTTETETESRKYNGWTNYETWAVSLWMGNDQGSQEYWQERAKAIKEEYATDEAVTALAGEIREGHRDEAEELLEGAGVRCSVYADLLIGALSEVNWREVAERMLED